MGSFGNTENRERQDFLDVWDELAMRLQQSGIATEGESVPLKILERLRALGWLNLFWFRVKNTELEQRAMRHLQLEYSQVLRETSIVGPKILACVRMMVQDKAIQFYAIDGSEESLLRDADTWPRRMNTEDPELVELWLRRLPIAWGMEL